MFLNFLNPFTMFLLSPDGQDGGGEGGSEGGNEETTVSFGSVKFDTTGMSEEQINSLNEVKKTYDSSSNQAIELNKKTKTLEQQLKEYTSKGDGSDKGNGKVDSKSIEAIVEKLVSERMKDLDKVTSRFQETNIKNGLKEKKELLSTNFKQIGEDNLNNIFKDADDWFEKLPSNQRSPEIYEAYSKNKLADMMKDNIQGLQVNQAKEILMNNAELKAELMKEIIANENLDVNLPEGMSLNSKEAFEERITELQKEINQPRLSEPKRDELFGKIAELTIQAKRRGYTI
jgi:hypothetical protein